MNQVLAPGLWDVVSVSVPFFCLLDGGAGVGGVEMGFPWNKESRQIRVSLTREMIWSGFCNM